MYSDKMIEFKCYGMYRSGTNLIEKMVEKCFDRLVHSETLGNKHEGFNKKLFDMWNYNKSPNIKLLICIKNPYAWVVSFSKWQIKNGEFTDKEITPLSEVSCDTISRWCQSYNWLYKHWMNLPYEKELIKYEQLISNPRGTLDVIADRWKLKYRTPPHNIENVVNPGGYIMKRRFDFFYYFEHRYILELNSEQIETIKNTMFWEMFPYSPEPPAYQFIHEYTI